MLEREHDLVVVPAVNQDRRAATGVDLVRFEQASTGESDEDQIAVKSAKVQDGVLPKEARDQDLVGSFFVLETVKVADAVPCDSGDRSGVLLVRGRALVADRFERDCVDRVLE